MKLGMTPFSRCVLFGVCASVSQLSVAQATFPTKPIRLIAPSSAGGPVDVIARIVAQGWSEVLGEQIVIDNRAGAAGMIGAELVARAAPDGYTLLLGFSGPLVIVPQINAATPYDVLKDFAPISLAASAPYVLLVHPGVPAKSVKELVALAKAQPGKLNFSSGGTGTGIHMAGELFKLAAGVQIVHVPLQRRGTGNDGADSGRSEYDVQRLVAGAAAHKIREAARTRGRRRQAFAIGAGFAYRQRKRVSVQHVRLVWRARAPEYTAAGRREAA